MENTTKIQNQLIEKLKKTDQNAVIRWSEERGVASVLQGKLMEWNPGEKPQELLRRWLHAFGQLLGSNDVFDNIEYVGTTEIPHRGVQIRAMQKAEGLPIYGATLLLFADKERGLYRVQSGLYRDPKVPPARLGEREIDFKEREKGLAEVLRKRLEANPKGLRFSRAFRKRTDLKPDEWIKSNFPIVERPKLWLYPARQGLRQVFAVAAYQPIKWSGVSGDEQETIEIVTLFIDARNGHVIVEQGPLGMSYVDTNADGLSTLVDGSGAYNTRPLLAVQDTASSDFLLINRTRTPKVVTHDVGGTSAGLENKFQNETDIASDTDSHWDRTTTSCTASDRANSQQPETDGHFFAEQAFNFYDGLGWQGFDNGRWGAHCPVRVAVHTGLGANASFWRYISNGKHYGYIQFLDGTCSGNTILYDFMAGDPAIFAHEYQHGITYFGARDGFGNPGYLETIGWHRAIHEGLSDAMAGLRTELWVTPGIWPNGAARGGKPFRRIEFPRSTDTKGSVAYLDHFDDRNTTTDPYIRSTILSHAIFLAGQGGVHQRLSRSAELIPVVGIGTSGAAEILHYAVTNYFDNIPANTTDGNTMIEAARLILDAAETITGTQRSCAYVMLRRAFYAVGLYPYDDNFQKTSYGGEACMLPWTYAWWRSRPYLGFPALWWQSPDLFVNNGNGAEYDAKVGVENKLFARVRNIGDQAVNNVTVKFFFIAFGTNLPPSSAQWKECKDQAGNKCVLNIPVLAAGSMNFTDVNNPPASQAVNWYLDPAEIVQGIDHFCVRADISCDAANNDNDCPNSVQSNVSYTPVLAIKPFEVHFLLANWKRRPIPAQVEIKHTLPKGFKIKYLGQAPLAETPIGPRERLLVKWQVTVPARPKQLRGPPYDGRIAATIEGVVPVQTLVGELEVSRVQTSTVLSRSGGGTILLDGWLIGSIEQKAHISGKFKGEFNPITGKIAGKLKGTVVEGRRIHHNVSLSLQGSLEPLRVINFTQKLGKRQVGGVSIKLKIGQRIK